MLPDNSTITAISSWKVRLPFDHGAPPPLFAGKPRSTIDSCWVQVQLSNGLKGWGESYAADLEAVTSIIRNRVAPLLIGKSLRDVSLIESIERALHNMGRSGPVLHAISGVDIALWDLRAKLEGIPLHDLLGGKRRESIPAYASLLQYYGDTDAIKRNVKAATSAGFTQIKLHEKNAASGLAAREEMSPGAPLMMDTNCAWLPGNALEEIEAMLECTPYWIEEPVWPPEDASALKNLRLATRATFAAGENASSLHELTQFVGAEVVSWIQPSAIKCGGVTALLRVAAACRQTGVVKFSPQTAFFGPGFLATMHVLAALEEEVFIERLFCKLRNNPYEKNLIFSEGGFHLPSGAGLGLEPDMAMLQLAASAE